MSVLSSDHPLRGATADAPLIDAYRGIRQPTPPVWFMRQAGRSLPEYRELRAGTQMLDSCLDPEMVTEITLQPVRRHRVDAAIFFSDIVVPLHILGVPVEIVPGKGPVLDEPVRSAADIANLQARTAGGIDPEVFAPITAAVGALTRELKTTPLIGFAGAPFTLAAYLVEGGPSKDHLKTRALMHADPALWHDLLTWIADLTGAFLSAQVTAGASAAQLFDSWAGGLSLRDYTSHVAPHSARALQPVRSLTSSAGSDRTQRGGVVGNSEAQRHPDLEGAGGGEHAVPTVHFGVSTAHLLPAMHDVGVDVIGVDWKTPLDQAAAALPGVPLQGNLDPALLSAPWEVLSRHVGEVIAAGVAAPAHVLNLGHGVPPDTDPAVLTRIVEAVHSAQFQDRT